MTNVARQPFLLQTAVTCWADYLAGIKIGNEMKTKFTINREIFLYNGTLQECYEHYEKYYKEDGWQLDKEHEEVFMIIDKEINLNEGDRVDIRGIRLVTWKCVNVLDEIIEYSLEEE